MPLALVNFLAFINEQAAYLFGIVLLGTTMSRTAISYTQRTWTFNCSKAEREIGYKHVLGTTRDAIAHYVRVYREAQGLTARPGPPPPARGANRLGSAGRSGSRRRG